MTGSNRALPISLVLGAILSVQVGSAIATTLFDEVGPGGAVFLRMALGAIVVVAIWRPTARAARGRLLLVALFAVALACMNASFYAAIDRIPLGLAVTFEFIGPLGVAIAASRRWLDLVWAGLAASGIVLLAPTPGGSLDALGVALALTAGGFWAVYIVVTARVGRAFEGGEGLAIAMAIASVLLAPVGIADAGAELVAPGVLGAALAVATLSSVIPYSLELEALRRIPQRTFGVLMSLEPAVGALAGLAILGQQLSSTEVAAVALVVAASAGALGSAGTPPPVEA